MPSDTIKISSEIKEQLEKDAKANFRSIAGQANYYIKLGRQVHCNQLELAKKIMEEKHERK